MSSSFAAPIQAFSAHGGTVATHLRAAGTTTTDMAAPLDGVVTWVRQWGSSLQVLGGAVLVICVVVVGIRLGAKSAVSSSGGSGMRETMGSIFGLLLAGLLIGAALILGPIFISVGTNTG